MSNQSSSNRVLSDVRGVGAVEFAFVAPIMIALLLGIVEMGRLFLVHNALTFATDEAARTAMVRKSITASELENVARSFGPNFDPATTTVTISIEPYTDGWRTSISMRYNYRLMVDLFGIGEFSIQRTVQVNRRDSF